MSLTSNQNQFNSWHGKINLIYANQNNTTKITHNHTQAPLKIQQPFYPEGPEICHSVILHTAGGIVGGDQLSYNIHLQPNTHALITNTSATKIYRSPEKTAHQTINIKLDNNAHLEWLPQETIIFKNAKFRQDIKIELQPKSTILLWEINRFGRTARGETFTTGHWRSNIEIWQQNQPLWIDRQQLIGSPQTINSQHTLAGFPLTGTLTYIGNPISTETLQKIRQLSPQNPNPNQHQTGITRLPNGLICRYRGHSTPENRTWFINIWDILRQTYQNRPNCPPRVWPL